MAKFKKGDIIRVSDETDPGFQYKHYYEVIDDTTPYILKSLTRGTIYSLEQLKNTLEDMKLKNMLLINYNTVQEWIEDGYRLVTKQEIILHGRKEIQENI